MRQRFLLIFISLFLISCQLFTPIHTIQLISPTPEFPTATTSHKTSGSVFFDVHIHPEDGLYVGDLVSFEVISRDAETQIDQDTSVEVELQRQEPEPVILGQEYFHSYGIGERQQATFNWVWDTSDLDPGDYDLTFRILPEGPEWVEIITLFPQDALPPHALDADWITTESQCCQITYLTGTAAARDIEEIIQIVDEEAAQCLDEMAADHMDDLHIVLLPRVLGHGGFASGEVYVSYLDRNYAGDNFETAIHHEMIHIIDLSLDADTRPRLLMEGLAVYQTGGHYKTEPLLPRAAALLELGWYIPLEELVEDFYSHQHEIGYLEAGALIEYLIDQWGYEVFDDFYRDIYNSEGEKDRDAIDDALQSHLRISFADLSQEFFSTLQSYPSDTGLREDVVLTVELYDTIRRYQLILDPSAHFLTAWLITLDDLQSQDIAADYLRHPSQLENLTIETLLISAQDALLEKDFETTREILVAVNSSLDSLESNYAHPFSVSPISERYYEIVSFLVKSGYQPQQIRLNSNSAHIQATQTGPNLIPLVILLNQGT
ncbi:MAG: hypothetical protein PVF83_04395 [Anaerolineales bacterium]